MVSVSTFQCYVTFTTLVYCWYLVHFAAKHINHSKAWVTEGTTYIATTPHNGAPQPLSQCLGLVRWNNGPPNKCFLRFKYSIFYHLHTLLVWRQRVMLCKLGCGRCAWRYPWWLCLLWPNKLWRASTALWGLCYQAEGRHGWKWGWQI